MTKYFCDRCGQEQEELSKVDTPDFRAKGPKELHVCTSCYKLWHRKKREVLHPAWEEFNEKH